MTRTARRDKSRVARPPVGMAARPRPTPAPRPSLLPSLAVLALALKTWVAVLVFDPRASDVFSLPKGAAGTGASLLLVAVLVAYARRSSGPFWVPSRLHWFVLAYAGVNVLAAVLALDRFVALFGAPGHYLGLTTLVDLLVLYVAVVLLVRREEDARHLCALILLATAPLIAYEAVQRARLDPLRWSMPEAIFSTLGNPNVLGGYLAVAAAMAAALMLSFWRDLNVPTRAALAALSAICSGAVLYTATRGALLGLAAGAIALIVFAARRGVRPPRRVVLALVALAAVALVAGVPVLASTPVGERLEPLTRFDASTRERLYLWRSALQLVVERPLLGVGPDNFMVGYPSVRAAETARISGPDTLSRSTHSWVLRGLTDAGLAGFLAYVAMLLMALWLAWRARTPTAAVAGTVLVAYLAQGAVAVDHVGTEWITWLCLGLIASLPGSQAGEPSEAPQGPATPTGRSPWRKGRAARTGWALDGALIGLAVLGGMMAWQSVRASELLFQSTALLARGDRAGAIANAQEATRLDPNRAAYWNGLGVAYDAAGRAQDAIGAFQRAAELNWYQSDGWRNLAIAHLRRHDARVPGADRAALAAAERAVAVEPNNAVAHFILSRVLLALREDERAAAEAERAAALFPSDEYFEAAAIAYVNLRRWEDAERVVVPRLATSPIYQLLAAHIYLGTGRTQLAKEQLETYLRGNPNDPGALALLKRIQGSP